VLFFSFIFLLFLKTEKKRNRKIKKETWWKKKNIKIENKLNGLGQCSTGERREPRAVGLGI
jgi:hypothetical protein